MNVLSLFDGISVGQIALNRAGIKYDKYYASEIDVRAIKVTQHNYPNTIQLGSVIDIKSDSLPKIDLILGGSPCQGFSRVGKGLNFEDPRSKLFFEFVRLLSACKPRFFLLENVKMKKEYRDIVSNYLKVDPILINSSLVSAQNRERYYWTNIKSVNQPNDKNIILNKTIKIRGHSYFKEKIYNPNKLPSLTTSRNDYLVFDNGKFRYLNPNEREWLQTIDKDYTSSGLSATIRNQLLGNCWTADIIVHILKNISLDN